MAAAIQLNRFFSADTLPIDASDYHTNKEGQVKGISKDNCQKILAEYGITRLLAAEGGRTSRGTMALMHDYAELINELRPTAEQFTEIEQYWVKRIRAFFTSKPFKLESDNSLSVDAAVEHLLQQAAQRQKENPGTMYVGTVLQHLVAAKLTIVAPEVEINGASVADDPTGRGGDFNVGDTAIHCTTAPASLLMDKCQRNIKAGLHPIIITVRDRVKTAWDLAPTWASKTALKFGTCNRSFPAMCTSMATSPTQHVAKPFRVWSRLTTKSLTNTKATPAYISNITAD